MSIVNNEHIKMFANYSWNTMNATIVPNNTLEFGEETVITFPFEYQHEFVERCYLLHNLKWFMLVKGSVYFGIMVIWIAFVWYVWGDT